MEDLKELCAVTELKDAIEDAKAGQLSRHWQRYIEKETCGANGEHVQTLTEELKRILASVPQLTDAELEAAHQREIGNELLYFAESSDYGTEVTLIRTKEGLYTATASIDKEAFTQNRTEYLEQLRAPLKRWAETKGCIVDTGLTPAHLKAMERPYYRALDDALCYLFAALNCPEEILY